MPGAWHKLVFNIYLMNGCANEGACIFMVKSVGKLELIIVPQMKIINKTNPVSPIVKRVFCLKFRELNNPLLYHGISLILFTPYSWINIFIDYVRNEVSYKYKGCAD